MMTVGRWCANLSDVSTGPIKLSSSRWQMPMKWSPGETFALRVEGESMKDDGIFPGDLVVVRKQGTARNGQTVVALVNNEATIKKYYHRDGRIELHPANAAMKPIILSSQDEFSIQGIVAGVIRHFNES